MKIMISGGKGNLAQNIIEQSSDHDIVAPSRQEMNVSNLWEIEDEIKHHNPDVFIHAAAYTRPMHKHQDNPDKSIQANIIGTSNVVLACMKHNIKLVYISTDYVYPGTDGDYNEDDALSPFRGKSDGVTKYGWSKLGGECAVRMYDNSLILRTCICDYPFPHSQALTDVKKSLMYNFEFRRRFSKRIRLCF
jgi:dTDP-4-dehydrorhamnose reductase